MENFGKIGERYKSSCNGEKEAGNEQKKNGRDERRLEEYGGKG